MRLNGWHLLIAGAVALVVLVAAGAVMLAPPPAGTEDPGTEGGDVPDGPPAAGPEDRTGHLEYAVTGEMLFIPFSGSLRLDVLLNGNGTYTVIVTPSGLPGVSGMNETYPLEDGDYVNGTWRQAETYLGGRGELVGRENITTALGVRAVDHYYNDTGTNVTDTYVDRSTGLPLLIERSSFGLEVRAEVAAVDLPGLRT